MLYGFGERLTEMRELLGLSQVDVGLKIGVSKQLVSKYEKGQNLPPPDVLMKFAKLYQTTTDYLLGLETNKTIVLDGLTSDQKEAAIKLINDLKDYFEK